MMIDIKGTGRTPLHMETMTSWFPDCLMLLHHATPAELHMELHCTSSGMRRGPDSNKHGCWDLKRPEDCTAHTLGIFPGMQQRRTY